VTVFDPNEAGSGASYGNAGLISTGGVVPIALPGLWRKVPKMLLDPDAPLSIRWRYLPQIAPFLIRMLVASRPKQVEEISIGMANLLQGAHQAYVDLLGDEPARSLIHRAGLLYTYASETAFAGSKFGVELRRKRGVNFEVLGGAELRQVVPALHPGHLKALLFPDTAHATDPQGLVKALIDAAHRNGAVHKRERVEKLNPLPDGRILVRLAKGESAFEKVVIAAGAWSKKLARDVGARVPLDAERGYHAMLPQPGIEIRVPLVSVDYNVAVTPMRDGLRVTGMVEFAGVDAPPDWTKAERVLRQAKKLLPDLSTDGVRTWMGPRPSLPGTLPLIAPAPAAPNAILAFGHGHLGMSFGAVTGLRVADLVAGRDEPSSRGVEAPRLATA
jgi:D-amino-acid dehydrogenase